MDRIDYSADVSSHSFADLYSTMCPATALAATVNGLARYISPGSEGAHIRFLPPYRPDFNPIELAFAKLKAFLPAAQPRTFYQV